MANYDTYLLADALLPRPPVPQIVQGIIPAGSVSIFYGYPGSLKSLLIMDMAVAIVTGDTWLKSMPNSTSVFAGYKTQKAPVLWIDLDNGYDVTAGRLAAFSRSYKTPDDAPLWWMSYPTPTIQLITMKSAASLQKHIAGIPTPPALIVIDTLLRAAHVKDENASEMDTVLNNIHKMAEDLKAAIILISHSKKENNGRAGNGLRGHSSIEGGVDAVFQVKRENHSDIVEIENQKARRKPVDTFSARWTFLSDPCDPGELQIARFYHEGNAPTKAQALVTKTEQKIIDVLTSDGSMNKSALFAKVGGHRSNFEATLNHMVTDKKVIQTLGNFNANLYSIP